MLTLRSDIASTSRLHYELKKLTIRMRLANGIKGLGWAVAVGLMVTNIVALLFRFIPVWTLSETRLYTLWFLSVWMMIGTLAGFFLPSPITNCLRIFDRRMALDDRLTTAWEISQDQISASSHMKELQLEQTLHTLNQADVNDAFPLRPSQTSVTITAVMSVILIPLLFMPNMQDAVVEKRILEEKVVASALEQLNSMLDTLSGQQELTPGERAAVEESLNQAKSVLEDRQTSLEEKLSALLDAEYKLSKLRALENSSLPQKLAGIQQKLADDGLPANSPIQQLMDRLSRGDIETASVLLNELSQGEADKMLTEGEIQALADILAQLAETIQENHGETASDLRSSAEALTGQNQNAGVDALQRAVEALENLASVQNRDALIQQIQAGVQLAQQPLRQSSGQVTESGLGQTSDGAIDTLTDTGQSDSSSLNNSGEGGVGTDGNGAQDGGTSNVNPEVDGERLEAVGGEITLPRGTPDGDPALVPGTVNESRVPYHEVYMEYAGAAESSLSKRTYPPLLRDYIRDYFSSLDN